MTAHVAVVLVATLMLMAACGRGDDATPALVTPEAPTPSPATMSSRAVETVPAAGTSTETTSFVLELVDTSRTTPAISSDPVASDRSLPTQIHLPAGSAPAPLIVLAHGMDGHPDKFTRLATYWAEAGYAVAAPAFPLSSRDAPDLDLGAAIADIPGQAGDIAFVIDELVRRAEGGGRLAGRIDADRIGLFGLSLGSITAWTTMLGDCCGDERIDALIQSDGAPLLSSGDVAAVSPDRLAGLPFPVMLAHSDADATLPYADVRTEFESLPDGTVLLTLHDFVHATVAENTETTADEAFRQATTTFWDRHLGNQPDTPFPATVQVDGITTLEPATHPSIPATR